jgi:putative FmdB family regulatory protein
MPLYEYRCETCGSVFEVMQKFADNPLTVHESCGGAVQRLLSAPALQFKGSGWYITDYARGGKSEPNGGEPNGGKKTEGAGSEKKTESKPASSDTSSSSSSTSKDSTRKN